MRHPTQQTAVLNAVRNGAMTSGQIAQATGMNVSHVCVYLIALLRHGEVERTGYRPYNYKISGSQPCTSDSGTPPATSADQ